MVGIKEITAETLAILESGRYTAPSGRVHNVGPAIAAAAAATRSYSPEAVRALRQTRPSDPSASRPWIEVTDETTQAAAARLLLEDRLPELVLLNFASARNAGGGFIKGAKAQEEDLCRASGLYPCLLRAPDYYAVNRAEGSVLYTDHLIYSPSVPFFRGAGPDLLESPCFPAVITSPAPNAGELLARLPDAGPSLEEALRRRSGQILDVARTHGHKNLLLGAWGCGVFRNDPAQVARIFAEVLEEQAGAFERVIFAVYDRGEGLPNLTAFRGRFG